MHVITNCIIVPLEVEEAPTHLKLNKAPGTNGISAEMIKLLGEEGVKVIHNTQHNRA